MNMQLATTLLHRKNNGYFGGPFGMRSTMSVILAGLLIVQSVNAQQSTDVKQRITALPVKAHVELALTDGSSERGRIASRADRDFVLKPDDGGTPKTVPYQQVRAVEQLKGQQSKKKWIVIGVVGAAVVVLAIIAIHLKNQPIIR